MDKKIDLKEIERKAWTSVFQDGLWDIYIGMLLLSSALQHFLSDLGTSDAIRIPSYISVIVLGGIILWAGKRYITVPRAGRIRFGPKRKARINIVTIIVFIAVILTLGLYLFSVVTKSSRPEWWAQIPFSAVLVIFFLGLFTLVAQLLDYKRLIVIGVMFAVPETCNLLSGITGIEPNFIANLIPALIVLLMGLVVFVHFLQTFPTQTKEAANDTP